MKMNDKGAARRLLLFRILVPLAAIVLSLAMIELGLAVFYPVPFSIETNMYFEDDPYTGYRLKPGGKGVFQLGIPGNANSRGHRDDEVSLKKPPGVFRILVIGDSFTVGSNVRQEDAYPQVLERKLKSAYGSKIEVVNTGIGGWDPFQYAEYYEHYGYQFEPDLIVVGFFVGNDAYSPLSSVEQSYRAVRGHLVSPEAAAQQSTKLKVFLYDNSHLARLFLTNGPIAPLNFLRKQCDDFSEWYLAVQKDRMPFHLADSSAQRDLAQNSVSQIHRIKDLAGKTPVIVALLPDENQINSALQARLIKPADLPKYDFKMPQSMLTGMFRDIGLPTIDVLPAVKSDPRCLYMNDTHWTPEGHEVAASVILDGLKPILAERIRGAE